MSSIGSIGFTAGGIDVSQIVSALIDAERAPVLRLQQRQAEVKLKSDTLARLRSNVEGLRSQAAALLLPGGFRKVSTTTTSPSAVAVSASSTALPGSISFSVDRLARAHGMRSAGTVASSTSLVTTRTNLAISTTASALGVTAVSAAAGVTPGEYEIEVTQSTVGAVRTGTASLAATTVVGPGNDAFRIEVDGIARDVTIAAGTYDAVGLRSAVQAGLDAVGAAVTASVDTTGRLVLTSTHEGSAASLRVDSGTALADLRLGVDAVPVTGTDGTVVIGTNPPVTVTSAGAGTTVAVATGSGDLTLTLGGPLRTGTADVAVVSTGDRSLGAVANAINAAGIGASAAAVKVTDGAWLLQLSSGSTGEANALVLDAGALDLVGGSIETSAAQDARITIGTGPGAYSVEASGNTFADLLPGVTITALAESASQVTVGVARNDAGIADTVGALVDKINAVIAEINLQTKYDTATQKSSPLSSDSAVRSIAAELRSAVTSLVGGVSTGLASNVGITGKRDGTLAFDRARFLTALQEDSTGVERLFARGGTSTGDARWADASDVTVAGSYDVVVTAPATRATTGEVLVGGSPTGQRVGVRIGTTTVSYQAAPGASAADIVAGLNAALGEAGLQINAETTVGGGVSLTAVTYGGAGSFEVNLDVDGAGSWSAATGSDVVGTIDGVAAVGVGRRLRLLDADASPARGLSVEVAEGVTGALGPVSYDPGIAARVVHLAGRLTGQGGGLTTSAASYDARIKGFTEQIETFENRMILKETQLRRQWTAVQNLLASLQNQSDWLTNQIKSLPSGSKD